MYDSLIVKDENWKNLCWVPLSFDAKVRKLFPKVYTSPYGDIHVYDIQKTKLPK